MNDELRMRWLERQAEELIKQYQADTERFEREAAELKAKSEREDAEAKAKREAREQRDPFSKVVDHYLEQQYGAEPDYTKKLLPDPKQVAHERAKLKRDEERAPKGKDSGIIDQIVAELKGGGERNGR